MAEDGTLQLRVMQCNRQRPRINYFHYNVPVAWQVVPCCNNDCIHALQLPVPMPNASSKYA